jgi:hypothetical protein
VKFANNPKPAFASAQRWVEWETEFKKSHPFIFWVTEEFLYNVQNVVMWIPDLWDTFRIYIDNRFVVKTHMISTHLQRGVWHETEERLLHGAFNLLVDFVECELATHGNRMSSERHKEPWWMKYSPFKKYRFRRLNRSREAGMRYLEWEMDLKHDYVNHVSSSHPNVGELTPQALAACEQMELYLWWVDVRPFRPQPGDLTGRSAQFEAVWNDPACSIREMLARTLTDEEIRLIELTELVEQAQRQEDTDMLERLVRVRQYLWS